MNNFKKRVITGLGLVVVILTAIKLGPLYFVALLLLINLLSLQEFYRLLDTPQAPPARIPAYLLSGCLMLACLLISSHTGSWKWLLLNLPATFSIFIIMLYRPTSKPFQALAITLLGVICISVPIDCFLTLPFLRRPAGIYDWQVPLGIFSLLWANDTGAYLIGSLFGKHALFQRISPHKTWEGSLGGAVAALTAGYILTLSTGLFSILQWETIALIVVVCGTYGDLFKSMLKRSLKIKDSGTMLPGHGGMLDRFDSLFGAAPFIFGYLIMIGV